MFCVDTSRVIKFTREELLYALKAAPRELRIGWGRDQRTLRASVWGTLDRPFIWAGFSGAPLTEEAYRQSIRSYIKEPLVDALGHGSLHIIDGIEVPVIGAKCTFAEATVATAEKSGVPPNIFSIGTRQLEARNLLVRMSLPSFVMM